MRDWIRTTVRGLVSGLKSRRDDVLAFAAAAGVLCAPGGAASGQSRQPLPGYYVGASIGLGVLADVGVATDVSGVAPVFGLSLTHGFRDSAHGGVRFDATLSPVSNTRAYDGLDARTHLVSLTAGPQFTATLGSLNPYAQPMIGGVAALSRGTTVDAFSSGPFTTHEVDVTTFAFAYGLALGAEVPIGSDGRRWIVDLAARMVAMSTLTFVQPDTDTYDRNSLLLEVRVGLMVEW